jgi:hypothetical protein
MVYVPTANPHQFVQQNCFYIGNKAECEYYRQEMMENVIHYSPEKFHQIDGHRTMVWLLADLYDEIMKGECYFGVLSLLIVTDMIQVLIRMDYITRREMDKCPHRMKIAQRYILTILCPTQLWNYRNYVDYADPMIINEWEKLLKRYKVDPPPPLSEKLHIMYRRHECHAISFHQNAVDSMRCSHPSIARTSYFGERAVDYLDPTSAEGEQAWKEEKWCS